MYVISHPYLCGWVHPWARTPETSESLANWFSVVQPALLPLSHPSTFSFEILNLSPHPLLVQGADWAVGWSNDSHSTLHLMLLIMACLRDVVLLSGLLGCVPGCLFRLDFCIVPKTRGLDSNFYTGVGFSGSSLSLPLWNTITWTLAYLWLRKLQRH